jgi:hypothetical protein
MKSVALYVAINCLILSMDAIDLEHDALPLVNEPPLLHGNRVKLGA